MKRLNWQFKRLPFIKLAWFSTYVILLSCDSTDKMPGQATLSEVTAKSEPNSEASPSFKLNSIFSLGQDYPLKSKGALLAQFASRSCQSTSSHYELGLSVSSIFGPQKIQILIPKKKLSLSDSFEIQWEGTKTSLPGPIDRRSIEFLEQVCSQAQNDGTIEAEANFAKYIAEQLNKGAPDCQFTAESTGWQCTLKTEPTATLDSLNQKLEDTRSSLLRGWIRQPYLLSRRMTVMKDLLSSLKDPQEHSLDKFCHVLKVSLKSELPLLLTLNEWQQKLCSGELPTRKSLAQYISSKSLTELAYLLKLTEKIKLQGLLSFRYPSATLIDSQHLWVKLDAGEDVRAGVLSSYQDIWQQEQVNSSLNTPSPLEKAQPANPLYSDVPSDLAPVSCWHPGFVKQHETLWLATYLGIIGDHTPTNPCEGLPPEKLEMTQRKVFLEFFQNYVLDTISAETAFTTLNGVEKVMDLPRGGYTFTIYKMPRNLMNMHEWKPNPSDLIDRGHLPWVDPKPKLIFSKK